MATVIVNEKEKEVPDNSAIQSACEELGIPFCCQSGFCRTCEVVVLEGMDNLSERNENEEDLEKGHRLACQCLIKKGKVKMKSVFEE